MTQVVRVGGAGRDLLRHPAGAFAARLLLASVLLYAGLAKVGHAADLARIIYGYRLLHPELVDLAGMTLPWLEMLTGVLLLLGLLRPSASAVACGLFVGFVIAAGLAMARGIDAPCGCFSVGSASERIGWELLARDGLFALLSGYLVVHPSRFAEMDALLGPGGSGAQRDLAADSRAVQKLIRLPGCSCRPSRGSLGPQPDPYAMSPTVESGVEQGLD